MEVQENFEHIIQRFQEADLKTKIDIYTTVQGLSVEQYKELLKYFPIKHIGELDRALN